MKTLFAALHESVYGTTRTFRDVRAMSVIEGISEVKYSLRVFRLLTLTDIGQPILL
jgi:hypothetical protein